MTDSPIPLDWTGFRIGGVARPPGTVTHGWRWWGVKDDRLCSPVRLQLDILPRDGVLNNAYFVPSAETMFRAGIQTVQGAAVALGRQWRDGALTFGSVQGPFIFDRHMPGIGSMRATRYQTKVILANNPGRFVANYGLPAIANDGLATMLSVERDITLRSQVTSWQAEVVPKPPSLHILFMCSYNVGRSPMAAAMFTEQLRLRGLGDVVKVSSAGTFSWIRGNPIDAHAASVLRAHGYPVPIEHRSTWIGDNLPALVTADLIVVMERQHAIALAQCDTPANRVRLLRSFDPSAGMAGDKSALVDLPNPCSAADFENCFKVIKAALPGLHEWVVQKLNKARADVSPTVVAGAASLPIVAL